jgi:hypothetical protein
MNLPGHRIAACLGEAPLKTRALQTLPRGPLTRPRARSVWSASDLSTLFVRRGTASGSWSQCVREGEWGLSMNRTLTRPSAALSHPMGEGGVRAFGHSDGSGIDRVGWADSQGSP